MKKNIIIRNACFICSSPYQVIIALSIVLENPQDADLYVYGTFSGYQELVERLRKYQLFQNIYAVDLSAIGVTGRLRCIWETFFADRIVRKFLPDSISYNICYFSSRSSLKSAQLKVLLDRNPEMRRVMMEDGMGTYSDKGNLLSVSKSRRVFERVLRWKLDDPGNTKFMVNCPELVNNPAPFDICEVERISVLKLNSANQQMLFDIYSLPDDGVINEKCIIFDTKRHGTTILPKEQMTLMDKCYSIVAEHIGYQDVILKPHPRSTEECLCGAPQYTYPEIPMEVLYAEMSELEKRILVSFVSTAVFTPKILFDAEPFVICLHRIVKDNRISSNFESIFEKFRKLYNDPLRVMAPGSLEELETCLQMIKELK